MKISLFIFLMLGLVSCSGEIVDTDGIESAAVKASENLGEGLKQALTGESLKTSTVKLKNIHINGVQKIFESRIDSLKSLKITIVNPRENVGINGLTGRAQRLSTDHFGSDLHWQDLGLVVIYEGSELLPDVDSIIEKRDPRSGAISQVSLTYSVEGNTEDILQVFIGNDFSAKKLKPIQRVLAADVSLQVKSKTDLNNKPQLGGF